MYVCMYVCMYKPDLVLTYKGLCAIKSNQQSFDILDKTVSTRVVQNVLSLI